MLVEQTFSKWRDKVQSFDGPWTLLKLDVLEKYLIMQAMKNQNFNLRYIVHSQEAEMSMSQYWLKENEIHE